jgi:2-methylisocitrate lyase-like PEP mutase family enzyme
MSLRPWRDITRRTSRQIMVGKVPVGGDAPIAVQTMTNTLTSDPVATIDQIRRCEEAGADIIRVSCPDVESTAAMKAITRAARVPIVADIHFHYKRALEAADAASTLAILVRLRVSKKWCAPPRPMAARSASASTVAVLKNICSTNMASPARKRWLIQRWSI